MPKNRFLDKKWQRSHLKKIKKKLADLEELKKSVLKKAFNGELK